MYLISLRFSHLTKIFLLLATPLLHGCGATMPTARLTLATSTTHPSETANHHNDYNEGYELLTVWEQGKGDDKSLNKALTLLAKALKKNPENVYYQLAHYNAYTGIAKSQGYYDEHKVLALYKTLNPILHDEVASPAFYTFYLARENKLSLDIQREHIERAIQQNPMNAQNWSYLSRIFAEKKHYWLSIAAAKRAVDILPDIDYYQFQVGYNLDNLAAERDCVYDEKKLLQRSAYYLTQAASKNINEAVYLDNQGFQYLQLGIIPLAYQQIKKAFEMKPSVWIAMHYAEASILMKRYKEAEIAANYLIKNDSIRWAHNYLAMIRISEGAIDKAAKHIMAARKDGYGTFYSPAQIWLLMFTKSQSRELFQNADEKILRNNPVLMFINEDSKTTINTFLGDAKTSCERSLRDFFIAQKYWQKGDEDKAKMYLEKVKKSGATRELSYLWASVLLDTRY